VIDLAPHLGAALTDASQLENAILNLAINARDAMPHGGTITITTANEVVKGKERFGQEEIDAGDYTVVCVGDTGVGMSPATLEKVFEPFFTTKPIGQGTGLGLSMIYGFAKQSRGHVRVESTEGKGTTFRLYLPRYQGSVEIKQAAPARDVVTGSGETVLVVEDDSAVRLIISDVLRDLGYASVEAGDGQQDGVSVHTEERISQPSGVQNQEGWGSSIGVVSANIRMPPSCGTPDDASHGNDV